MRKCRMVLGTGGWGEGPRRERFAFTLEFRIYPGSLGSYRRDCVLTRFRCRVLDVAAPFEKVVSTKRYLRGPTSAGFMTSTSHLIAVACWALWAALVRNGSVNGADFTYAFPFDKWKMTSLSGGHCSAFYHSCLVSWKARGTGSELSFRLAQRNPHINPFPEPLSTGTVFLYMRQG